VSRGAFGWVGHLVLSSIPFFFFTTIAIPPSFPFPGKGTHTLVDCSEERVRDRRYRLIPGIHNPGFQVKSERDEKLAFSAVKWRDLERCSCIPFYIQLRATQESSIIIHEPNFSGSLTNFK
jgi:hypothetical protein